MNNGRDSRSISSNGKENEKLSANGFMKDQFFLSHCLNFSNYIIIQIGRTITSDDQNYRRTLLSQGNNVTRSFRKKMKNWVDSSR